MSAKIVEIWVFIEKRAKKTPQLLTTEVFLIIQISHQTLHLQALLDVSFHQL